MYGDSFKPKILQNEDIKIQRKIQITSLDYFPDYRLSYYTIIISHNFKTIYFLPNLSCDIGSIFNTLLLPIQSIHIFLNDLS